MKDKELTPVIITIKDKCRVCYTCVRECPTKAIKITNGQAEIIPERCIGCGNCVKVCSQKAKKIRSSIEPVLELLKTYNNVAAIIAPSFPAEFNGTSYKKVIAAIKNCGFKYVNEVAFGADLVASTYKSFIDKNDKAYITTSCPGVVSFVEKYHPNLLNNLLPIVSPMIATALVLKNMHGEDLKIVFIGPCIAKKAEINRTSSNNLVDEVLTFLELKELFSIKKIDILKASDADFDPPHSGGGSLFSLARGSFNSADIEENLIDNKVISAEGRKNFIEAIKELQSGYLETNLLDILCCEGCIMGPAMSKDIPLYKKRYLVSNYVKNKFLTFDKEKWENNINIFKNLDLTCSFKTDSQILRMPKEKYIVDKLKSLGKNSKEDELNCGACGYETCRDYAIALFKGLAEEEMCLPYTINKLKTTVSELANSYKELKSVKESLFQKEKLANMGQLSAGIAHELNNPLGIVLMYSNLLLEQFENNDIQASEDIKMIVEQANRCKKIVSGLLNFSRQNKVLKENTNIVQLINHCFDALKIPNDIKYEILENTDNVYIEIDKDQFSQVIMNIISNSIDAIESVGKITVEITRTDSFEIIFKDTGKGISKENIKHVFDPFFTTKKIGSGTGLGLAVSFGIIKMHQGKIEIVSNDDILVGPTGTSIIIKLPLN